MAKEYEIDQPPRLLFTGTNGSKTAGIGVKPLKDLGPGYRKEWTINASTIRNNKKEFMEKFDLDEGEYNLLVEELDEIEKKPLD